MSHFGNNVATLMADTLFTIVNNLCVFTRLCIEIVLKFVRLKPFFLLVRLKKCLKLLMKRTLSFNCLNEPLKLLGMLIWSYLTFPVVLEIFRLMWYANDLTCDIKRFIHRKSRISLELFYKITWNFAHYDTSWNITSLRQNSDGKFVYYFWFLDFLKNCKPLDVTR